MFRGLSIICDPHLKCWKVVTFDPHSIAVDTSYLIVSVTLNRLVYLLEGGYIYYTLYDFKLADANAILQPFTGCACQYTAFVCVCCTGSTGLGLRANLDESVQ